MSCAPVATNARSWHILQQQVYLVVYTSDECSANSMLDVAVVVPDGLNGDQP